jgi:RNA polymerase sigma-70 factor (ECF subfamily)
VRVGDVFSEAYLFCKLANIGGYLSGKMTHQEQEQTFLHWQTTHRGILLKVARSYAVAQEDQEDLIQQILVQLWHSVEQFNGQAKPSTWIYRVALNTAMDWQRGEKRRRERVEKLVSMDAYWLEQRGPENERLTLLYEAIHQLPAHERYLVLLYLEDLPYSEIAEIIGISESNVGVRITRVRKKLTDLCNGGQKP